MMRCGILFLVLFLTPMPAAAQNLVADLSSPFIAMTTGFTGADLLVFGSTDQPGDIAITIEGPAERTTVRQKSRRMGVWANTDSFIFDKAPGFYAIATSKPASQLATPGIVTANGFALDQLRFPVERGDTAKEDIFQQALVQNKQAHGLYQEAPLGVRILSDMLFRASFTLPADVPIGTYKVHIYLLRGGKILTSRTLPFAIGETGANAAIYNAARDYPFLYALAALCMALTLGGGSAFIFRRIA